jgi:hypothetical protein
MRLLGTIAAANAASTTNATTAGTGTEPFALPEYPCSLYFEPAATGLRVKFGAAATSADFQLGADPWILPWAGRAGGVIALRNDTGAPVNCKVFATDAPGFMLNMRS